MGEKFLEHAHIANRGRNLEDKINNTIEIYKTNKQRGINNLFSEGAPSKKILKRNA